MERTSQFSLVNFKFLIFQTEKGRNAAQILIIEPLEFHWPPAEAYPRGGVNPYRAKEFPL